jgi:hypothetical protein
MWLKTLEKLQLSIIGVVYPSEKLQETSISLSQPSEILSNGIQTLGKFRPDVVEDVVVLVY